MFEIGSALRDARVRRNISLQQAEEDTKIRVKYIQAMENEDFDILPAGTYVKGFLRTYAEYLDLDYQIMIDEYNERFGSGDHKEHLIQPQRPAKADTPKRKHQTNYMLVAIIAVIIIAVLAYLDWGNPDSQEPFVATTTANTATRTTESVLPNTTSTATVPVPAPTVLESMTITATDDTLDFTITRDEPKGPQIIQGQLQPGESVSLDKAQLQSLDKVWLYVRSSGLAITVNGKQQTIPEFDPESDYLLVTLNGITKQAA